MKRYLVVHAGQEDDGRSVRDVLKKNGVSSSTIKRAKKLESGLLKNGESVFSNAKVKGGDELQVCLEETREQTLLQRPGEIQIAYEDEWLLAVNKRAGLSVHPSPGNKDNSLLNHLSHLFAQRGENIAPRAVNRLDRPTSGLMLVAKDAHAHFRAIEQMRLGTLQRRYLAIVMGDVGQARFTIDAPIKRRQGTIMTREVAEGGARAVTHAKLLARGDGASLLLLSLETGRTHQIRVHMASIGHPLYGDFLYGKETAECCMLHACYLSFKRLADGERRTLWQLPPPDFMDVANKFSINMQNMEEEICAPF